MSEEFEQGHALPLEWHVPEDLTCQFATNLIVQHTGHEFIVSFFQVAPPIIFGPVEEAKEQLASIESVKAECVARIVIASSRMPAFVKALQDNLEKSLSLQDELRAEEDQ